MAGLIVRFALMAITFVSASSQAAESLLERAPDLDSLHKLLAPVRPDDLEDRAELATEQATKITAIETRLRSKAKYPTRLNDLLEVADLRLLRALTRLEQAHARYAKAYDAYFIGTVANAPTLDLDNYKDDLLHAVNHLRDWQAHAPSQSIRRAEVNFLIATTLARTGNDHCEVYFKRILGQSNRSEWVVKARIARADYLVSKQRFDEANGLYLAAFSEASSTLKTYINYRLAWMPVQKYWDKGDKARQAAALATSKALITTFAAVADEDDAQSQLDLRMTIAQDLVWIWAVSGQEQQALAFLDKHDLPELQRVYLERLALEQISRHQVDLAKKTFTRILADDPEIPEAPDYHLHLARAYYLAGNTTAVQAEIDTLKRMTHDDDHPWYDEFEDDKPRIERIKQILALLPLSGGMTLARAAEGEKNSARKAKLLDSAITELSTFVRNNSKDPQVPVVRLALVSALVQNNRLREALSELDELYKLSGPNDPQREAIVTERLRLLIKLDETQKYATLPAPGEVVKPIPLPELKQRFAAYTEDYLAVIPNAEGAVALRFQIAQDLFLYGHYSEALLRFESLVNDYPASEQAKTGIEVLLSMNLKLGRWDELIRLSTAFLNNRAVKGKSLREYVKENLDYARTKKSS